MQNRFFIALMVLALVAMPCAKIATAYANALAEDGASFEVSLEALIEGADFSHEQAAVVAADEGEQKPLCKKSCTTWQGVVPRPDDLAALGAKIQIVVDVLGHTVDLPNYAPERTVLRARAPPRLAGSAFSAFYAKTSRFLS